MWLSQVWWYRWQWWWALPPSVQDEYCRHEARPQGAFGGGRAWFPKWTPPIKMSPKYQRVQKLNFKYIHCNLAPGTAETWGLVRLGEYLATFMWLLSLALHPQQTPGFSNRNHLLTQAQVSHQSAFHHHLLSFGFCILHFAPNVFPLSKPIHLFHRCLLMVALPCVRHHCRHWGRETEWAWQAAFWDGDRSCWGWVWGASTMPSRCGLCWWAAASKDP